MESVNSIACSFHALCQGLASMEITDQLPLQHDGDPLHVWEEALAALITGVESLHPDLVDF